MERIEKDEIKLLRKIRSQVRRMPKFPKERVKANPPRRVKP